jgi:acetyl-CoA carboxylase carboxyl transferase subunit beta
MSRETSRNMTRETSRDLTRADDSGWQRCRACAALVYGKRLSRNLFVCPECGDHGRLSAEERAEQLLDSGTFAPLAASPSVLDVLGFIDSRPYPERWADARRQTGLDEAVRCGSGRIEGHEVVIAIMDFGFMGGSLGAAVGEMITMAAELALDRRLPFVVVTASGGARMQEGCLALMQMAKTSIAIGQLREQGLLTVSVVTDPTYGGVAASFATNTDVIIAEAGARLGFAGPRVIRQTMKVDLPAGFQGTEFLVEHGQVDIVEERSQLRSCLGRLLTLAAPAAPAAPARIPAQSGLPKEPVLVRDAARLPQRDAWETVQTARDIMRPTTLDYLARAFDSFVELHGDRVYGDNAAVVAGLAEIGGIRVAVVGHQKGHTTAELVSRDFGLAKPEGYRKAVRIMMLAERLGFPVVTLVDTPGAHPGVEAEERGQASAIADAIQRMASLRVPVVSVVIGEGGSGGALALAVADQVLVAENATYSVISPEGCSSILWNDPGSAPRAARALGIVAPDLLRTGIADGVVPEPPGGAQADHQAAADALRAAVLEALAPLLHRSPEELLARRQARFRRFGATAVEAFPHSVSEREWAVA